MVREVGMIGVSKIFERIFKLLFGAIFGEISKKRKKSD